MRVFGRLSTLFIVGLMFACSSDTAQRPTMTSPDPVAITQSSGSAVSGTMAHSAQSATVQFGNPDVGSGYPPGPSPHDQSGHAVDSLVPVNVVIDAGGTVTFNTGGVHEIAIYEPGKGPEDVDTSALVAMPAGCQAPPLRINDPVGRIAINGLNPVGCGPRVYTHTFDQPGKYLVICEFLPHFQVKMYGWVTVRDRQKT
jgi:plastocyanin